MDKRDIVITYGTDIKAMTKQILACTKIEDIIGSKNAAIGLKPNLVVAKPASSGATTHPEILEGIIEYLKDLGFSNISIIEGSWVGDRTSEAFKVSGYNDIARRHGVKIIDTQKDTYKAYDCRGMKINICDSAMNCDFMINLPVLKGHCQTLVTCALKNNKGVIPNTEKRKFHTLGLHKPIAHLSTVAKCNYILVDSICGDLDFEEGGNPVEMNRLFAALDPVLCDSFVCSLMGYEPEDVEYIKLAEKLGVGTADTSKANIIELESPEKGARSARSSRRIQNLEKYACPSDACSACYGSLIHALNRLDDERLIGRIKEKVCIGQGYKGKSGVLGVGSCTRCFEKSLPGCPPKAIDIYNFLKQQM